MESNSANRRVKITNTCFDSPIITSSIISFHITDPSRFKVLGFSVISRILTFVLN
ncbi:hypothetical protein EG68_07617 [Paragonimus skrjabini miyazakii]|uniref:Uncharacterized protein n=1 Tax=Paragonimus skrjabini miyazakii TaxID=59628 RepID=A0A8S9YUU4_9TREM|nr:hypothetical protein EG68_07617 [Paragonimus skrjabini miyazakii]